MARKKSKKDLNDLYGRCQDGCKSGFIIEGHGSSRKDDRYK